MAAKKAPKKAAKAPATKAPRKEPAPKKAPTAKKGAAPKEAPKPAKKAAAPRSTVPPTSIVIPFDVYEPNKDAIKAPFKEHEMKWSYLGEDAEGKKGIYRRDGVNVFAQFKDDGVHYTMRGDDVATREAILAAWKPILGASGMAAAKEAGAEAAAQQQAAQESEALRLWRLQEPQRRPGEPDFFFEKRRAEWEAKKPSA